MAGKRRPAAFPYDRTLMQAFEVWINPEVERRRAEGRVAVGFVVNAAQIVMNVGKQPVVRLNDEVKLVVKVPPLAKPYRFGDLVKWSEVTEIALGPDDVNAGHMTVIRNGGEWLLAFDFRYNAEKANDCLDVAKEFLETAKQALEHGRLRPFAENLFGAAELAVKAKLLTMPDEEILKTKKHGLVAGKYNRWVKHGNARSENAKLLNRLGNMRSSARYLDGSFALATKDAQEMLAQAEKLFEDATARVPARRRRPERP